MNKTGESLLKQRQRNLLEKVKPRDPQVRQGEGVWEVSRSGSHRPRRPPEGVQTQPCML